MSAQPAEERRRMSAQPVEERRCVSAQPAATFTGSETPKDLS